MINDETRKDKSVNIFVLLFPILFPIQNIDIFSLKLIHIFMLLSMGLFIIILIKTDKLLRIEGINLVISIFIMAFLFIQIFSITYSEEQLISLFRSIKYVFAVLIAFQFMHSMKNNPKLFFKSLYVGIIISLLYLNLTFYYLLFKVGFNKYLNALIINSFSGGMAVALKSKLNIFFGGGVNLFATWVANCVVYIFIYIREVKKQLKLFDLIIIFISTLTVILSISRTAMLGIVFGLIFYYYLFYFKFSKKKIRNTIMFVNAIALILIIILVFNPLNIKDILIARFIGTSASVIDGGKIGRIQLWIAAYRMIIEKPFLGHGLGSAEFLSKKYNPLVFGEDNFHNIYLGFWAETGLFSLLLFLGTIALIFISLYRISKRNNDIRSFSLLNICLLSIYLFEGLLQFQGNNLDLWIWIGTGMGLIKSVQFKTAKE